MPVRQDVVAPRRDHAHNCVKKRGLFVYPSHTANNSNVAGDVVIGEDRRELLGDLRAAVHLAAVETDDQRVVDEQVGAALRVLSVPRLENLAMELLEPIDFAWITHAINLPASPKPPPKYR